MRVDDFDFFLPDERIALRPLSPRDSSRMLVVDSSGNLTDSVFLELGDFLDSGDALVFNDTRVISARLDGVRHRDSSTASVSVTLHKRLTDTNWLTFVKGAKKVREGDIIEFGDGELTGEVVNKNNEDIELRFDISGSDFDQLLDRIGIIPLPPYISGRRDSDSSDLDDYQTMFARHSGAVASPTAGLHFTPRIMEQLQGRGVESHFLTLHVGAGTFMSVKASDTSDHKMHSEFGIIDSATAEALNEVRSRGNRVVSVGTTSLRLLESAAAEDGTLKEWHGSTDIFITPGYRFGFVDALLTNFHLPRSTLFMLVCAMSGTNTMKRAYAHAIESNYRFYSYGDCCLLFG